MSDDEFFPRPRPWYRSPTGETVLGLVLCLVSGAMFAILQYMVLPWFVDRTAALVLFVSILGMGVLSGHAMTRAFGPRQNS